MNLDNKTSMTLNNLELNATLGWPDIERAQPQKIIIDINIQFVTPPKACITDTLEDTVCYDTLVKIVKNIVSSKEFHLLEHLGYEIYRGIKESITQPTNIGLYVKKQPPIPELTGGAAFYFGD